MRHNSPHGQRGCVCLSPSVCRKLNLCNVCNGRARILKSDTGYQISHVTVGVGSHGGVPRGAPSTADGHLIAFGNTLESLVKSTLGLKQRGEEGQRPFDRTSGEGFVAAHDGDYADALRKRRSVVLFNTETSGAVGPCTSV